MAQTRRFPQPAHDAPVPINNLADIPKSVNKKKKMFLLNKNTPIHRSVGQELFLRRVYHAFSSRWHTRRHNSYARLMPGQYMRTNHHMILRASAGDNIISTTAADVLSDTGSIVVMYSSSQRTSFFPSGWLIWTYPLRKYPFAPQSGLPHVQLKS